MIYAIEAEGTPYIKFGVANSAGKRLNQMQTGCPHELSIILVADWPDHAERSIHKYLENQHHKREWFCDSPQTSQVIEWMKQGIKGLSKLQDAVGTIQKVRQKRVAPSARVPRVPACDGKSAPDSSGTPLAWMVMSRWTELQSAAMQQCLITLKNQYPLSADSSIINEESGASV